MKQTATFFKTVTLFSFLLLFGVTSQVMGQFTLAQDDASNYTSWGGSSNQGGFGFSEWDFLTSGGDAGFFIGNSTQNSRTSINTDGNAFGMFTDGGDAFARRAFAHNDDGVLQVGESFIFEVSFSWADGRRGVDFWAEDDFTDFLLNVEHAGNDRLTIFTPADGRQDLTPNEFNEAWRVEITWLGGATDNLNVKAYRVSNDEEVGNLDLTIPDPPKSFTLLYTDGPTEGEKPNFEPYFNSFMITSPEVIVNLKGSEGFRLLSAPTTTSLSNLLDPIWTQGAIGADFTGGDPNVFTWDNTSTGDDASNWSGVTDLGDNLTAGTGILVYVYDLDDLDDSESDVWPKTLSVSGTGHGDTTPAVNQEDGGFTLLGNPFATTIDFDELDKDGLTNVAYVWDPNDNQWKTYPEQSGTGELADGLIAPFQGFFVQSTGSSASVTFNDDAKSSGGTFYGKQNDEQRSIVRLELNGEELRNSTWLRFSDAGSLDSQIRGDALQLEPLSENFAKLATEKSGTLFDISHLPLLDGEYSIPMHISATMSGSYTLTATDFELPDNLELTFHDHANGTSVPLNADFSYTIELAQAAKAAEMSPLERVKQGPVVAKASAGSPQYSITVSSGEAVSIGGPEELPQRVALNQNYPNPFNPSTVISYDLPEASDVTIQVYDMTGRQVATLVNSRMEAGTHEVTFNAGNLASGVYIYRLQAGEHMLTRKLTLIK